MNVITLKELEQFGAVLNGRAATSEPHADDDYGNYESNRLGDWSGVVAGCAFAQSCSDEANASTLSEPSWYALASLLGSCENGLNLFHEISAKDDAIYDAAETDAKFAQARTASAPRTCRSIRDEIGFDGCQRCTFWRHA